MGRVYEQLPHPKIAYAYLAIEAATWNEFEQLRAEALKKHPLYAPSAFEKPAPSMAGLTTAELAAKDVVAEAAEPEPVQGAEPVEPAATAPTEGLSPRDKARAKMAAKKEA